MSTTAPVTPPPIGRLKAVKAPALLETELPGGLHSVFVRHRALPLVELRLVVPLTAAQVQKPASTSVLSEAMFAGTERHDRLALAGKIEGLGGRLVAHVDEDRVVLVGSVLAEHLAAFLGLFAEVLTMATYPDAEVRADRERAADEMVIALSQPEVAAQQALRRRMFAGHPYATPLPTPAALRRVKAPELRLLHSALLSPVGAHLVLVGDFQVPRARAAAEEALGEWLGHRGEGDSQLAPLAPTAPRAARARRPSEQCSKQPALRRPRALPVGPPLAGGIIGRQRAGRHVHLSHYGEPAGTPRLLIFTPRPLPSFAGGLDVRAGGRRRVGGHRGQPGRSPLRAGTALNDRDHPGRARIGPPSYGRDFQLRDGHPARPRFDPGRAGLERGWARLPGAVPKRR